MNCDDAQWYWEKQVRDHPGLNIKVGFFLFSFAHISESIADY